MSTTTIRLDARLKARLAAVARRAGKTTHAFVLDAIAQTVDQLEHEHDLDRLADERWAALVATGRSLSWEVAKSYVRARARGTNPRRPKPRRLER